MSDASHNPLKQFEPKKIFSFPEILGLDTSFTNASLYMCLVVLAVAAFFALGTAKKSVIPGRFQALVEFVYGFIYQMVRENAGNEAVKYFPAVFSLFIFILFANLLGMLPGSFAITSHIIVTFAFASFVFVGVTAIGFYKHGTHFFDFFVPKGLPGGAAGKSLTVFMIFIELLSYLARPISLSIRLAANITAGHALLKIMAGFVGIGLLGAFPFAFIVVFTGFELFIACLQAYIFALLSTIYLNDALNMH